MACIIIIEYTKPKDTLVSSLKNWVFAHNGEFNGDTSSGSFQVNTPIGSCVASYQTTDLAFHIQVIQKPSIVTCKRIKKEIERYLLEHDQTSYANKET